MSKDPSKPKDSWLQRIFGGKISQKTLEETKNTQQLGTRFFGRPKHPETENPKISADFVYNQPKSEELPQKSPQNPQVKNSNQTQKSR